MKNKEKKKILVIEDSEIFKNILVEFLSVKYNVHSVANAETALQLIQQNKPNLILLDIMLHGNLDGFSFLKIIKKDAASEDIPIIIISALSNTGKVMEGLHLGANDYMSKPIDLKQLDLKIKNALELQLKVKEKPVLEKTIPFEVYQDNVNLLKSFELQIEESILNDKNTPIKEIAAKLNISQSTLERIIKKKFDMSPNKYISKRKLEKADILLHSNMGMSIKEISFSLGFNSVSYFIKCYKKMYHRTPSQI